MHPWLAILAPLLLAVGCDDPVHTPCVHCDAGTGTDAPDTGPSLDVPDASTEAGTPWRPTSRDAPAGEAQVPTPIPDAGFTLLDDFAPGTTTEWEALDLRNGSRSTGTWTAVGGASGSLFTQGFLDGTTWHIAYAVADLGADQIVEARLRVVDFYAQSPSYMAALFGRYDPATDSGYFVALRADGGVTLRRRERGSNASWGGSAPDRFRAGVWYTVRLEIIGNAITAFIDGVEVGAVSDDDPLPAGTVGLGAFGAILEVDRVAAARLD